MIYSEADLKRIIAGQPVGDQWPYADGGEAEIEAHLKRVVAEIGRSATMEVEADFNHSKPASDCLFGSIGLDSKTNGPE